MKIRTKDAIVQSVLKKMDERSLIGQKKYGSTMMQEIEGQEKDLNRFLVDGFAFRLAKLLGLINE